MDRFPEHIIVEVCTHLDKSSLSSFRRVDKRINGITLFYSKSLFLLEFLDGFIYSPKFSLPNVGVERACRNFVSHLNDEVDSISLSMRVVSNIDLLASVIAFTSLQSTSCRVIMGNGDKMEPLGDGYILSINKPISYLEEQCICSSSGLVRAVLGYSVNYWGGNKYILDRATMLKYMTMNRIDKMFVNDDSPNPPMAVGYRNLSVRDDNSSIQMTFSKSVKNGRAVFESDRDISGTPMSLSEGWSIVESISKHKIIFNIRVKSVRSFCFHARFMKYHQ